MVHATDATEISAAPTNSLAWQRTLSEILRNLTRLPARWDGYAGKPVTDLAASRAREILDTALCGVPSPHCPSIVPMSDGSVQIEWHRNGLDLELTIYGDSGSFELWLRSTECYLEVPFPNRGGFLYGTLAREMFVKLAAIAAGQDITLDTPHDPPPREAWRETINAALRDLTSAEVARDGQPMDPATSLAAERGRDLLEKSLSNVPSPVCPDIALLARGGVLIEWHRNHVDLELRIDGPSGTLQLELRAVQFYGDERGGGYHSRRDVCAGTQAEETFAEFAQIAAGPLIARNQRHVA